MTYDPKVDDYVIWKRPNGDHEEGWIYFKGDKMEKKRGFRESPRYITIEVAVKDKPECRYTRNEKHKKIHTLLLCNEQCWHQLEYVKNRRVDAHYEELAELQRQTKKEEENEDKFASMYKSQDRPLDIDSYGAIPPRY